LNGDQEKKLNESLSAYIFARNECQVISYVAFTYPELVASYKAEGDSLFKDHFNCNKDSVYLEDPTIRQTEKKGRDIHVLYELSVYNENSGEQSKKKHEIVGVSNDDGRSWFFMDRSEYVDKSRLPKLVRLLKLQ
jgi:hypothetical protein